MKEDDGTGGRISADALGGKQELLNRIEQKATSSSFCLP